MYDEREPDQIQNKGKAEYKPQLHPNFLTNHINILFVWLMIKVFTAWVQWPLSVWLTKQRKRHSSHPNLNLYPPNTFWKLILWVYSSSLIIKRPHSFLCGYLHIFFYNVIYRSFSLLAFRKNTAVDSINTNAGIGIGSIIATYNQYFISILQVQSVAHWMKTHTMKTVWTFCVDCHMLIAFCTFKQQKWVNFWLSGIFQCQISKKVFFCRVN